MPATSSTNPAGVLIRRDMRVTDILAVLPEAEPVLSRYGLSCVGCALSGLETIEEGGKLHGFEDRDIDDLISDLNILLEERPKRPSMLTVTRPAAEALKGIMEAEGKTAWTLKVTVDETGGFCMEFIEKSVPGDLSFIHDDVPDVRVTASPLTLARIGGAVIDLRDGRFKLDLPEDSGQCTDCEHETCQCGKK